MKKPIFVLIVLILCFLIISTSGCQLLKQNKKGPKTTTTTQKHTITVTDNKFFGLHGAYLPSDASYDAKYLRDSVAELNPDYTRRQIYMRPDELDGFKNQPAGQTQLNEMVVTIEGADKSVNNEIAYFIRKAFLKIGIPGSDGITGWPSNWNAYESYLTEVVESSDGDGINDFSGLIYPTNNFQVLNEFEDQWWGKIEKYLTAEEKQKIGQIITELNKNPNSEKWMQEAQTAYETILVPAKEENYFEIMRDYFEFMKETRKIILKANPNAKIITGGFTNNIALAWSNDEKMEYIPVDYLKRNQDPNVKTYSGAAGRKQLREGDYFKDKAETLKILFTEYKNDFDMIDLHLYVDYIYNEGTIRWFKDFAKKYGLNDLQVVSNENGAPFYDYTPKKHSEQLIKSQVGLANAGVKFSLWSQLSVTSGYKHHFTDLSLLELDGTKRPAFYAYKQMTEKLKGFGSVEEIYPNDKIKKVFKFTVNGKNVFVAWSDAAYYSNNNAQTIDLSQYISTPNVKVTYAITEQGQTQPKIETMPSNNIPITETPIFFEEII